MKIGILTAGGDCPGLNATIRAIARKCFVNGDTAVGLRKGFLGLMDPTERVVLDRQKVSGILHLGGTMLSISSIDPFREPDGVKRVIAAQKTHPLDAIIAIGGEHTMSIARRLWQEEQLPIIGVPKTIDNDVPETDFCFGFDTAVQIATNAIDRLHSTAEAHDRIMVIEVMGRSTGWIALYAGLAGGADAIVIPELELTVEEVAEAIERRHSHGKNFSVVVVSEGAELVFNSGRRQTVRVSNQADKYGYIRLGGIGTALAKELEQLTGYEARITTLGHLQRGGTPTATDRLRATRYGLMAAELATTQQFGKMAAIRNGEFTAVELDSVVGTKTVDLALLEQARTFFG